MEAAIIGAISRIAPLLVGFIHEKRKLLGGLEGDIKYIKNEFEYISAAIEKDGDLPQRSNNKVHKKWIEMVRDLARAIEDCIDNFTHRVTLESGTSPAVRTLHKMIMVSTRGDFAKEIKKLKQDCVEARKQRDRYITDYCASASSGSSTLEPAAPEVETETEMQRDASDYVGMDAAWDELKELIKEMPQGKPKKLKVISLVGFGGIGKSQLAKRMYNSPAIVGQYERRAWVRAAYKGAPVVLQEILVELGNGSACNSCPGLLNLRTKLRECLGNNRFFIVIDDMRAEIWDDLKEAFPLVSGISSRVIVTTDAHSIAAKCSGRDGHVYVMRTLDKKQSRKLFFKKASLDFELQSEETELVSQVIEKCDGLPLALVTTSRVLQGEPKQKQWADLAKNLGEELEKREVLVPMQRVLARSYTSLGSQETKACLLYLGIYPSGRPIRRGSLIRKWLAEGFIKPDPSTKHNSLEVAVLNFNKLVDQSIIQPITDVSSSHDAVVKTCQTHGMMLEFILHKSMCQNFITLYDEDSTSWDKIRWLSLQQKTDARSKMCPEGLSLVRSLTIFGEVHNSMLDFSKYKLLKVLDLEECGVHMEDSHLKDICRHLVLLRYLSLGPSVKATTVPVEIKMLKLLETLDVRRTIIEILPTEVMKLPSLVHLFGKFKLQEGTGDQRIGKLKTWLTDNSKLQTIAGFVVDERQEMPQLIEHMEHLTKVKIWCESTPDASINISRLSKAVKGFIDRSTDMNKAHSLSLNFNAGWPQDLLCFSLEKRKLKYLRSLKLQGNSVCSQLPLFVTNLRLLTKLCLSFPGHNLSSDILDALSKVRGLECLKLIATQLGKLTIREGELESLRSLCIMVEVMTGLVIEEGALPRLNSLQLLCKDLNGFSSTTIQSMSLLKEVALHDELNHQTKQDWKEAAENHPRRPKLLLKLMRSEPAAGASTGTIATDAITQEVAVERKPVANPESPAALPY